jgi:hypothetical protein
MKSFIAFMLIATVGFGENPFFLQFNNKFQNDKASYEVFKSLGIYHCLDKTYNDKKNSNFHKEYLSLESDLFYLKKEKELFSKYPLLNLFSEAELLDAYSSYEKGSLFYVVKRSNFESEKDLKLKVFKEKSKNAFYDNKIVQCQQYYTNNPKLKKVYDNLVLSKKNYSEKRWNEFGIDLYLKYYLFSQGIAQD